MRLKWLLFYCVQLMELVLIVEHKLAEQRLDFTGLLMPLLQSEFLGRQAIHVNRHLSSAHE